MENLNPSQPQPTDMEILYVIDRNLTEVKKFIHDLHQAGVKAANEGMALQSEVAALKKRIAELETKRK